MGCEKLEVKNREFKGKERGLGKCEEGGGK